MRRVQTLQSPPNRTPSRVRINPNSPVDLNSELILKPRQALAVTSVKVDDPVAAPFDFGALWTAHIERGFRALQDLRERDAPSGRALLNWGVRLG